jgi:co-chaperonin GroES (HSP10)
MTDQKMTAISREEAAKPNEARPRPLRDYVLIQKEQMGVTSAGLIIPEDAGDVFAIVVAVGPGAWRDGVFVEVSVKPGDRVLLDAAPSEIGTFYWGEQAFAIVPERCVACVLPGERPRTRQIQMAS